MYFQNKFNKRDSYEFLTIHVVNAVLLKLRPELYQSRYNSSAINVN